MLMPSIVMLGVIKSHNLVNFAKHHCAEGRYAECRYAECRYAEFRYAECHSTHYNHLQVYLQNVQSLLSLN